MKGVYWEHKENKGVIENISIGTKCVVSTCFIVAFVFCIILIVYNVKDKGVFVMYTQDHAQLETEAVARKIKAQLNTTQDVSSILVLNEKIQVALPLKNKIESMNAEYTLQYTLNNIVDNFNFIASIILYKKNGGIIPSARVNLSQVDKDAYSLLLERIENENTEMIWEDMHQNKYHIFRSEQNAITFRRDIVSVYSGESIGLLEININEKTIAELYQCEESEEVHFLIVNIDGQIVSASNKSLIYEQFSEIGKLEPNGYFKYKGDNTQYLIEKVSIDEIGWTVYRFNSLEILDVESKKNFTFTLVVGLIALVVIGTLLMFFIRRLMKPIVELSQIMDQTEGDVLQEVDKCMHYNKNDEAGRLIKSFQSMCFRIQELIEKIKDEQQQKVRLELLSLQEKINPHFLYNTLDSVCALIQIEKNKEAIDMLKSIELFYRGTLNDGNVLISLYDEIKIIKEYIKIQKYRFEGDLNVNIRCSEKVMKCKIPKLTLQPIVENAIYHGLKNGGCDGEIWITEWHDEHKVILTVCDNGVGFQMGGKRDTARKGGYGLRNTKARIQAHFGEEYGIAIESEIGKGTSIHICIPYNISEIRKKESKCIK